MKLFSSLKKLATTEAWTYSRVTIFSLTAFSRETGNGCYFANYHKGKLDMFLNAMSLFHELHVKKHPGQWELSNYNYWFPSPWCKENSWSICHKLFLNIHPTASLFFLEMTSMLGFYQQHTFLKRHRTYSLCCLFRSYFSFREMQRNLDTILGNQL